MHIKRARIALTALVIFTACAEEAELAVPAPDSTSKDTVHERVTEDPPALAVVADSKRHIVRAGTARFEPLLVFAKSGDEVCWTNMTTHDSQAIEGLIPEGAEAWHTPLDTDACVTLHEKGVYIYKCNPHYALGMGGAIVVEDTHNLARVENQVSGKARRIVNKLKQALEAESRDDN